MADRMKLLDRLAERWLCCRYRWNVRIFRGARVRGLQYRPYRVLHSRQLMFRVNPKFDLLRVDEWERFGNSVIQLRNVIHVAERLGVGAIAFPEKHPFFSGEHAGRIALTWGVTRPTLVPSIEGRFFELDAFRLPMSAADAAAFSAIIFNHWSPQNSEFPIHACGRMISFSTFAPAISLSERSTQVTASHPFHITSRPWSANSRHGYGWFSRIVATLVSTPWKWRYENAASRSSCNRDRWRRIFEC